MRLPSTRPRRCVSAVCCGCGARGSETQWPSRFRCRDRPWAALGDRIWRFGEAQPCHMPGTRGEFLAIHSFELLSLYGASHGAISTDGGGDNVERSRGVGSSPESCTITGRIKRPPPHRGRRGHLETLFHTAVLSAQYCFCGASCGASIRLFAEFLLGFA